MRFSSVFIGDYACLQQYKFVMVHERCMNSGRNTFRGLTFDRESATILIRAKYSP